MATIKQLRAVVMGEPVITPRSSALHAFDSVPEVPWRVRSVGGIGIFEPRSTVALDRLADDRHQRRHIAPEVEAPIVPAGPPDPLPRPADVLPHERAVSPGRFTRLALNPKARLKQRVIRRRQRLRPLPRHRPIRIRLARRTRDNQGRVLELRAVQREHVLEHELRGIPRLAVDVPLNVESDHGVAFREATLSPTTEASE